MLTNPLNLGLKSCSASTTATNSARTDKSTTFQGEVICDWLSFRHDFDIGKPTEIIASGKTLKLKADGSMEWEKQDFTQIRCPSSDTSIRVKCDGRHLWFQGNIGRFQQSDNVQGLNVLQCFEKASTLLRSLYPNIDLRLLGSIQRAGTIAEYGTIITRIDLASNFETDNYLQLNQVLSTRRIMTRLSKEGRFGATWGYEAKRGQFWKAKLYDKTAEQDGKRTSNTLKTLARFEVQLGSTYLRKYKLNHLAHWGHKMNTENIIYGRFSTPLFAEQATFADWSEYPTALRAHAIMWKEGTDPKTYLKKSRYYKVRNDLLTRGLDISKACNIMTLITKVKIISLAYAPTLRRAA